MRTKEFDRKISHDEAEKAALALIDEHFKNVTTRRVKTHIPVEHDDTDVVIMSYIRQMREQVSLAAELNQPESVEMEKV